MLGQGPFGRPNLAALAGEGGTDTAPILFPSHNIFFSPTIAVLSTQNISPIRFVNTGLFLSSAVTGTNQIVAARFTNQNVFFVPRLDIGLSLSRVPSANQFFVPSVTVPAAQNLTPGRFSNVSLFFVPVVDTQLKFVSPGRYVNGNQFFTPNVSLDTVEYVYTYPIGNQLDSDYGIRESMTFYKQRLVLGSRYGRRR